MSPSRPPIDVAVAVVQRADGAVLLGQRPAGKPYAGWWEFPGGKVEPGETVAQALARELDEELGLVVEASSPWVVKEFVYPHAHVRLHFRRVHRFHGEPQARENQAFAWLHPDRIDVAPLLPATVPVIGWLRLPGTYAISDASRLGSDVFLAALDDALARGVRLIQLREKEMSGAAFESLFHEVRARCRHAGARLLVNSAHPASFWRAADGVHLTQADLMSRSRRPDLPVVAASCHDAATLAHAGQLGLDFAVLGPVQATSSHPDAIPLGWLAFETLVSDARVPVFALGGLSASDREQAGAAGAHGVALLSGAWRSTSMNARNADGT